MQSKIRFFGWEQSEKGSNVHVEICVEVAEQVERHVRCTNLRREDGEKQQIGREVLRSVSKGAQHGWSKLVGLLSSRVQADAFARSEAAEGIGGQGNQRGRLSCPCSSPD